MHGTYLNGIRQGTRQKAQPVNILTQIEDCYNAYVVHPVGDEYIGWDPVVFVLVGPSPLLALKPEQSARLVVGGMQVQLPLLPI